MENEGFTVYRYRWIILVLFMCLSAMIQMLWITFAPITGTASRFYGVSDLQIGLLSMIFMIVYIIVSIPASWVIDTYGFRLGVSIGAALIGAFGLLRGVLGSHYNVVLVSQIGIALGQPFVLNSITKVAARWFAIDERATAAGLAVLSQYIGIVLAMALTPYLVLKNGIHTTLVIYGILAMVSALLFILFSKERPATPPCPPGEEDRALVLDGLRHMVRQKDFLFLLVIFFFGLGIFNAVATWIEDIVRPRGLSITQAGLVGAFMMIGGIAGATVIPLLSDRYRRRVPFILLAMICAVPGLIGLTFIHAYWLVILSGFVMGFFLMGGGPIGFQYGAEVTYPAPEGTSNGLLLWAGQISGILFIFGMDKLKSPATGSMTVPLVVLIGLMGLNCILAWRLRESSFMKERPDRGKGVRS